MGIWGTNIPVQKTEGFDRVADRKGGGLWGVWSRRRCRTIRIRRSRGAARLESLTQVVMSSGHVIAVLE